MGGCLRKDKGQAEPLRNQLFEILEEEQQEQIEVFDFTQIPERKQKMAFGVWQHFDKLRQSEIFYPKCRKVSHDQQLKFMVLYEDQNYTLQCQKCLLQPYPDITISKQHKEPRHSRVVFSILKYFNEVKNLFLTNQAKVQRELSQNLRNEIEIQLSGSKFSYLKEKYESRLKQLDDYFIQLCHFQDQLIEIEADELKGDGTLLNNFDNLKKLVEESMQFFNFQFTNSQYQLLAFKFFSTTYRFEIFGWVIKQLYSLKLDFIVQKCHTDLQLRKKVEKLNEIPLEKQQKQEIQNIDFPGYHGMTRLHSIIPPPKIEQIVDESSIEMNDNIEEGCEDRNKVAKSIIQRANLGQEIQPKKYKQKGILKKNPQQGQLGQQVVQNGENEAGEFDIDNREDEKDEEEEKGMQIEEDEEEVVYEEIGIGLNNLKLEILPQQNQNEETKIQDEQLIKKYIFVQESNIRMDNKMNDNIQEDKENQIYFYPKNLSLFEHNIARRELFPVMKDFQPIGPNQMLKDTIKRPMINLILDIGQCGGKHLIATICNTSPSVYIYDVAHLLTEIEPYKKLKNLSQFGPITNAKVMIKERFMILCSNTHLQLFSLDSFNLLRFHRSPSQKRYQNFHVCQFKHLLYAIVQNNDNEVHSIQTFLFPELKLMNTTNLLDNMDSWAITTTFWDSKYYLFINEGGKLSFWNASVPDNQNHHNNQNINRGRMDRVVNNVNRDIHLDEEFQDFRDIELNNLAPNAPPGAAVIPPAAADAIKLPKIERRPFNEIEEKQTEREQFASRQIGRFQKVCLHESDIQDIVAVEIPKYKYGYTFRALLTISKDNAVLITGFGTWVTTRLFTVPGSLQNVQFHNSHIILVPKSTNVVGLVNLENDAQYYFSLDSKKPILFSGCFLLLEQQQLLLTPFIQNGTSVSDLDWQSNILYEQYL